jgi:hypothetical protein
MVGLERPAEARVISRSAEISIGRETASQVEEFFRVDTDPVSVARVRRIGRRLAACVPDAPYPFEFHVVEDGTVNAFALPGGFIYVFRGLLQLLPNDDTLASVLGHELSHVTQRHAIKQFEKNLALTAILSGILAGTGGGRGANSAAGVVQALAGISFTRGDEKDADEHGIDILARAGYDPRAAAEAMRVLKRANGDEKSIPALFRTHPAPESRIKRLSQLATEIQGRRTSEKTTPRPPAPSPTPEVRLAGLEGVKVAACEWLPLATGARWTYRVKSATAETALTVRALEQVAAEPDGVYRVEFEFRNGIRTVRLFAPTADRLLSAPDGRTDTWQPEAVFAAGQTAGTGDGRLRCAGMEKVRVPAGEFDAIRVERLAADGSIESTAWYARGVGLVRRVSDRADTVQELTSYTIPRNNP